MSERVLANVAVAVTKRAHRFCLGMTITGLVTLLSGCDGTDPAVMDASVVDASGSDGSRVDAAVVDASDPDASDACVDCVADRSVRTRWVLAGRTLGSASVTSAAIGHDGTVSAAGPLSGAVTWGDFDVAPRASSPSASQAFVVGVSSAGEPAWAALAEDPHGRLEAHVLGMSADAAQSYLALDVDVFTDLAYEDGSRGRATLGGTDLRSDAGGRWALAALGAADGASRWVTVDESGLPAFVPTVSSFRDGAIVTIDQQVGPLESALHRTATVDGGSAVRTERWASHAGDPHWGGAHITRDGTFVAHGRAVEGLRVENVALAAAGAFVVVDGPETDDAWSALVDAQITDVSSDVAGNVYVAGCFETAFVLAGEAMAPRGGSDAFVVSFDRSGGLRWARSFGGRGADCLRSVSVDRGTVIAAGSFEDRIEHGEDIVTSSGGADIIVLAWSVSSGDALWAVGAGGVDDDVANVVRANGRGAAIIGGAFRGAVDVGGARLASDGEDAGFLWLIDLTDVGPGLCEGADCSSWSDACSDGVCDPASGACVKAPVREGASCTHDDRCRVGTICIAGACEGGGTTDCSVLSGGCVVGVCSPGDGSCTTVPIADGSACTASGGECAVGSCLAGLCTSGPAADCTACSVGSCAAGTCGAAPSVLRYDLDGALPGGWSVVGDVPWSLDPATGSATSGVITHGETSSLRARFDVGVAAAVVFSFRTSSDVGDVLDVLVDGALQDSSWSGDRAWTEGAVALAAGVHVVEWRYTKDLSGTAGTDSVQLDWVEVRPTGPAPESFETASLPASYSVSGSPASTFDGFQPWHQETGRNRSGASAVVLRQNRALTARSSALMTLVDFAVPTEVQFWVWSTGLGTTDDRVSGSWLRWSIDGSGAPIIPAPGWTFHRVLVAPGPHLLSWNYESEPSIAFPPAEVVLDDISFVVPGSELAICGS